MDAAGEMLLERLLNSLTNHTPTPEAIDRIDHIRAAGKVLALEIAKHCPDSRERSLAATHLEETVMWAVKSIVLESP